LLRQLPVLTRIGYSRGWNWDKTPGNGIAGVSAVDLRLKMSGLRDRIRRGRRGCNGSYGGVKKRFGSGDGVVVGPGVLEVVGEVVDGARGTAGTGGWAGDPIAGGGGGDTGEEEEKVFHTSGLRDGIDLQ
jgi:hypothetical protein